MCEECKWQGEIMRWETLNPEARTRVISCRLGASILGALLDADYGVSKAYTCDVCPVTFSGCSTRMQQQTISSPPGHSPTGFRQAASSNHRDTQALPRNASRMQQPSPSHQELHMAASQPKLTPSHYRWSHPVLLPLARPTHDHRNATAAHLAWRLCPHAFLCVPPPGRMWTVMPYSPLHPKPARSLNV